MCRAIGRTIHSPLQCPRPLTIFGTQCKTGPISKRVEATSASSFPYVCVEWHSNLSFKDIPILSLGIPCFICIHCKLEEKIRLRNSANSQMCVHDFALANPCTCRTVCGIRREFAAIVSAPPYLISPEYTNDNGSNAEGLYPYSLYLLPNDFKLTPCRNLHHSSNSAG